MLGAFKPLSFSLFKHEVSILPTTVVETGRGSLPPEAAASLVVSRGSDDHVILLARKREDDQTRWPRRGLPSGLAVAFSGVLTDVRGENGLTGSLGVQGHLKL